MDQKLQNITCPVCSKEHSFLKVAPADIICDCSLEIKDFDGTSFHVDKKHLEEVKKKFNKKHKEEMKSLNIILKDLEKTKRELKGEIKRLETDPNYRRQAVQKTLDGLNAQWDELLKKNNSSS